MNPFESLIPDRGEKAVAANPFEGLVPQAAEPKVQEAPKTVDEQFDSLDAVRAFGIGALEGVKDLGRDVELLIRDIGDYAMANDKSRTKARREEIAAARKEVEESPLAQEFPKTFKATRFGTKLAGEVIGPAKFAKGAGLLADVGVGAVLGGLQDPGQEGSRLQGALAGGAASGVLGAAFRGGSKLVGRGRESEVAQNAKVFEKFGVTPSLGQVRGSKAIQKVESMLKDVPVLGTNKFFRDQHKGIKTAIVDYVEELGERQSDDVGSAIQQSLTRTRDGIVKQETALYDAVAAKVDDKVFKGGLPATQKAITEILKKIDEVPVGALKNTKFRKVLEEYQNVGELNFKSLHALRGSVDDSLHAVKSKANIGNATRGEIASLAKLRKAMETDLEAFAAAKGAGDLYKQAKQFHMDFKRPFNDVSIKRILDPEKADVNTIVSTFIKSNRPELAKKLIKNLDKEGREAVEYGIVNAAFEKSIDAVKGLSPQRFAKELAKLGTTSGVALSKSTQKSVEGLKNLIAASETAFTGGSIAGKILPGGAAAGALLVDPSAAAALATGGFIISKMLTTKAGKAIFTRAAELKPGTIEMRDLTRKFLESIAAVQAAQGVNE